MQRKAAIAKFLFEFDAFESSTLKLALQSLSLDSAFVDQTEKLLDVDARLKLLERMAAARGVPASSMGKLQSLLLRAAHLLAHYTAISRVFPAAASLEPASLASALADADEPTIVIDTDSTSLLRKGKRILTPSAAQIQTYANDAIELQRTLGALATEMHQFIRDRPQDNR